MTRFYTILLGFMLASAIQLFAAKELPLAQLVNPLIGTDPNPFSRVDYAFDTGNVFPGAVCPRGMLAWSPDTTHKGVIAGGYWYPDSAIEDFSLTHFSGRGVPCLKDIPFMPVLGPVAISPGTNWDSFAASFSHTNETASAGYYEVKFDNGITTELTATPRTGMARFAFPAQSAATLLIRADSSIFIGNNEVSGFHATKVAHTKHDYTLYFVAQFDRPFQTAKTWTDDAINDATSAQATNCGAILTFDTSTNYAVQVRVGISYVSLANARANLMAENQNWNLGIVSQNARAAWNAVLNRIQVEGGTPEQQETFYTALYHCYMHPNILDDCNGEYPGMDEKIHRVERGHHQYQNISSWDLWRSYAPLMTILSPSEGSDMAQSLVNYAQQDASVHKNGGGLPRWEQVNHNSGGMAGDGQDIMISSAYAFGARDFDTSAALAAMDKGASDPAATSDGAKMREGSRDYLHLGYVPEKAAVTLEYCNDDFALAQFARAIGDEKKYATYMSRAENWKNLFDASTGLIRPREADGNWMQNFSSGSQEGYVEGTAAQYVWMVNFDLRGLIDKMGGDNNADWRLDHFFTKLNSTPFSGDTAYMGNEPCEETPWVYDFASAPWCAQMVVHQIENELFTAKPNGLPGNDDGGALSSWYVFSALGLYPEIPGVAGFVVGSPLFPKATIHLESGKAIQILAGQSSPRDYYIQSLQLNEHDYASPWIEWSALEKGAKLNFNLGARPSAWGADPKLSPPSFDSIGDN
jgi:predicted alpha-1,2-mannosidase